MDANSLRNKAANRRYASGNASPKIAGWKCTYCGHTYAREKSFLTHRCKGKLRLETMKDPIGQAAFASYNDWMKAKKHATQSADTFMSSTYFVFFIRFAELCKKIELDAPSFISFIVKKHPDIDPTLWCSDAVYSLWLKFYDTQHDPWTQLAETQEYLERQAEIHECSLNEVLFKLGFPKVFEAFRKKKISSWYLLISKISQAYLKHLHATSPDDFMLFEKTLNIHLWAKRLKENRQLVNEIDNVINSK